MNKKKLTSLAPLGVDLKALILTLEDSALLFVLWILKWFSILS